MVASRTLLMMISVAVWTQTHRTLAKNRRPKKVYRPIMYAWADPHQFTDHQIRPDDRIHHPGNLFSIGSSNSSLVPASRQKRRLIVPQGLTVGVIPRFDYTLYTNPDGETVTVSVEVEVDYTFPTQTMSRSYLDRMSRMLYDKRAIYGGIEGIFTRFGMDGKACVLKTICEVSATPQHRDGLIGDLLSYVLTASYGVGEQEELQQYLEAEQAGRTHGECAAQFSNCPISIFSIDHELEQ